MYYGDEVKPCNIEEFLKHFVEEVLELEKGFYVGKSFYNFRIRCIVANAPARSYIKSIKSHNGYYGCERCYRKGKYSCNRLLYPFKDLDLELLHTDESFAQRLHAKHQNGDQQSPLQRLEIPDTCYLYASMLLRSYPKLLLMWNFAP